MDPHREPGDPPKLLAAAGAVAPPGSGYPPPRRGRGLLGTLAVFLGVLAGLALVVVLGCVGLFGVLGYSGDSSLQVVHHSGNKSAPDKIAIISVDGAIYDAEYRFVEKQFKAAREDRAVKGVVLSVDSPGGTISASASIHRLVKKYREEQAKPVIVSMQSLAASGGYYISAPAHRIFAQPTTMTGSIGVIAIFPNLHGLMDKLGVQVEVIKTGPLKDAGSMLRDMKPEEKERWQEIINDGFEQFLGVVIDGRKDVGLDREKVLALANGGVYTANEAVKNGLVDELGYLDDAIAYAERSAGVSDANVIEYKQPFSFLQLLLGQASSSAPHRGDSAGDLAALFQLGSPKIMYLSYPMLAPPGRN